MPPLQQQQRGGGRRRRRNTIQHIAKTNVFPHALLTKLHKWLSHKLSLSPTNYIPLTTPKTWVTFTYYNLMICKLTNLFHNTNLKISFYTNNTNHNILHNQIHNTNTHTYSGIYQQQCPTCNLSYIGLIYRPNWTKIRIKILRTHLLHHIK